MRRGCLRSKVIFLFGRVGRLLRYLSGSVHYARVHPWLWRDRLRRVRAAGLNAVQFYVEWNLHEPEPGVFSFEEERLDFQKFIRVRH